MVGSEADSASAPMVLSAEIGSAEMQSPEMLASAEMVHSAEMAEPDEPEEAEEPPTVVAPMPEDPPTATESFSVPTSWMEPTAEPPTEVAVLSP